MRCKILHESKNRMRVHLFRKYMTCAEADKVEYFLLGLPYVSEVKVSERTSDAGRNTGRGDACFSAE